MAYQIIKQPDGLFCLWSTIVDNLVALDATKEEIIEYLAKQAANSSRERSTEIFRKIEKGEKPYYQFSLSWKDIKKKYNEAKNE